MKLIDLLVQELPKRGGWPEGVYFLAKDSLGVLEGHHELPTFIAVEDDWSSCTYIAGSRDFKRLEVADDHQSTAISREQYEAALAASKQPEWDGEGLPPVGVQCEFIDHGVNYRTKWVGVCVLAYGVEKVFMRHTASKNEFAQNLAALEFRPIRTEAERKREEAKGVIAELCRSSASNGHSADLIYDAIAAGKIPGIKLSD